MASRLILPVVPGVSVPTGLPPCPGLRGEPCRAYKPYANTSLSISVMRAASAPTASIAPNFMGDDTPSAVAVPLAPDPVDQREPAVAEHVQPRGRPAPSSSGR